MPLIATSFVFAAAIVCVARQDGGRGATAPLAWALLPAAARPLVLSAVVALFGLGLAALVVASGWQIAAPLFAFAVAACVPACLAMRAYAPRLYRWSPIIAVVGLCAGAASVIVR
ncbi:MAG: hypothetical protein AAGC56_06205 [Pseudomonadota bacterium]